MKTKILCILDGFGLGADSVNNAITRAKMPNLRRIMSQYFWTTLCADGEAVGQEDGLVGNSEVGHMNIGGLQLVPQLSYQITKSAKSGFELATKDQVFCPKQYLQSKFKNSNNRTVHLIGLFSTGAIHSDIRHWVGAIEAAGKARADKIVLHLISDGRDSDRKSLIATWQEFVSKFEDRLQSFEDKIFLGSVGGRFYAMDRDKNWERVIVHLIPWFALAANKKSIYIPDFVSKIYNPSFLKKSNILMQELTDKLKEILLNSQEENNLANLNPARIIDILQNGTKLTFPKIKSFLSDYTTLNYNQDCFDETLIPACLSQIQPQDTLWLINHRSDRMKQLSTVLCDINKEFDLGLDILSMNDYGIGREYPVTHGATSFQKEKFINDGYKPIFKTQKVQNTLAQTIAKQGQSQLHIAETEKYAHVTYFFNGGSQEKNQCETWELIPSNKVKSHAEQPEMKAKEITDYILDHGIGKYDYIIVNYANPDMVAHTGLIPESITSIQFLDLQLGRLVDEVEQNGHSMIITADHGNCEFVGEYTKKVFSFSSELNKQVETIQNLTDTEHNPNPVPCIIVDERFKEGEFHQSDFIISIQSLAEECDLKVDLDKLENVLQQQNQNLVTDQYWLSQDQINQLKKNQLPLWYVGVFLLGL